MAAETPLAEPSRAWRASGLALARDEGRTLVDLLAHIDNATEALAYDDDFCTGAASFAALVRDRRNERQSKARALEVAGNGGTA